MLNAHRARSSAGERRGRALGTGARHRDVRCDRGGRLRCARPRPVTRRPIPFAGGSRSAEAPGSGCRRCSPGPRLVDQEADRVGLVEQPQLAPPPRSAVIAWVEEHPAPDQDPVSLGHERGDPAHVEVAAARSLRAGETLVDIARHGRLPEARVGGVDRELAGLLRDAHIPMGEDELADLAVEGEALDAVPERKNQHRRGAIERVARADLKIAPLKEGFRPGVGFQVGIRRHREDRPD